VVSDLVKKSAWQRGEAVCSITRWQGIEASPAIAAWVGFIVGSQAYIQGQVEPRMGQRGLYSLLASSLITGLISSPLVAIFNGYTNEMGVGASLRAFSRWQALAISVQEAAFVAGLTAAGRIVVPMKQYCGDHEMVDYAAAYVSGGFGALAGHPANTAITRWQRGLPMNRQCMWWGAARRAHAIGCFLVLYTGGKKHFS
jgi:hypothetical protein